MPLTAGLLPEGFEMHARKSVQKLSAPDAALAQEFGFQEGESAVYEGKGKPSDKGVPGVEKRFTVSAWRLRDSTAALAAWQMLRPAGAKPVADAASALAAQAGSQLWMAYGNYVLMVDGFTPEPETVHQLVLSMPRFEKAALPALLGFLPVEGRTVNSERFIAGPASLEKFAPQIPPSVAAFQFDAEGIFGKFQDRDGAVEMVVFSYPNHQVAQKQITAFQGLAGVTASRSGPLIAVVTKAPNADAAQRVLSLVSYEATVTLNSKPPKRENLGEMILAIAKLSGLLIGSALLAGLVFAGIRLATGGGFGGMGGRREALQSLSLENEAPKQP